MAQVTVSIGGRSYRLACNEGEEAHLESLAREVDAKFEAMHKAFGEIGDQRLIVMAALTIADEFAEAREKISTLEAEGKRMAEGERAARRDAEIQAVAAAQAFGELSQRIEKLAAALGGPAKA
ncbi:MAG: cell division protein ZapA [Roseiarcus sp.]|jgi:cell division protein ZapA